MIRDLWNGGWMGRTLLGFSAAAFAFIALVLFIVGSLIYNAWDARFLTSGTVVRKTHTAAFTSFVPCGKVIVPVFHPEQWEVEIEGIDTRGHLKHKSVSVSETKYESLHQGDKLTIE